MDTDDLVDARPIGVMRMRDMGKEDDKIVAVEVSDPRMGDVRELDDLPPHRLREIENFFNTYKDLEGKETEVCGWSGRPEAVASSPHAAPHSSKPIKADRLLSTTLSYTACWIT